MYNYFLLDSRLWSTQGWGWGEKKIKKEKLILFNSVLFIQFSFLYFPSQTEASKSEKKRNSESSIITSNTTSDGVFEGRQANSYIKGDPLNGYYDFVITEGSYKFWVVFQVTSIIKWKTV